MTYDEANKYLKSKGWLYQLNYDERRGESMFARNPKTFQEIFIRGTNDILELTRQISAIDRVNNS